MDLVQQDWKQGDVHGSCCLLCLRWLETDRRYKGCAVVTITGSGSGLNSYPNIFVANIGTNQCKVPEGEAVEFPNPGRDVQRSGEKTEKPVGTNCV
jgi:hypothetical protein